MSTGSPIANVVVIDTDKYSGNFEREMCAYITGQYGECGVGDNIVEAEETNIRNLDWFDDYVVNEPDDHGCYRPCSIWIGPGGSYNSVAIFVDSFPKGDVLDEIRSRAEAYCVGNKLQYKGIRFFESSYKLTEIPVS